MKNTFLLTLFICVVSSTFAQSVDEYPMSMSLGKHNAFHMDIPDMERKEVIDVWKSFLKEYGKVKRNKKAKEYYSMDITIPIISRNPVDIYATFDEKLKMSTIHLWVVSEQTFVSTDTHPREAVGVSDFLEDFALKCKETLLMKEKENAEKKLHKLEKKLRKLEKKNKGFHKDIERAKKKIQEAEENIEQNLKDQEDERENIEQMKMEIQKIIDKINNLGKSKIER